MYARVSLPPMQCGTDAHLMFLGQYQNTRDYLKHAIQSLIRTLHNTRLGCDVLEQSCPKHKTHRFLYEAFGLAGFVAERVLGRFLVRTSNHRRMQPGDIFMQKKRDTLQIVYLV